MKVKIHRGTHEIGGTCMESGPEISDTKTIKAYFLMPRLHPLIDKNLVTILNEGTRPEIEFNYIKISQDKKDTLGYLELV